MLLLMRRANESIVIRDRETKKVITTISINAIKGRQVHLGFDSPIQYQILRSEIIETEDAKCDPTPS